MNWALALTLVGVYAGDATLRNADEWPPLRAGVWRIVTTEKADGKARPVAEHEERFCSSTMFLFQRYPTVGVIEKKGCRFESHRNGLGKYEIKNTCAVHGLGDGISHGLISVRSDKEFESIWETTHGGRAVMREDIKGRWTGPCRN
jgi:hypothetical protein